MFTPHPSLGVYGDLGDSGADSYVGRKGATKVFKHGCKSLGQGVYVRGAFVWEKENRRQIVISNHIFICQIKKWLPEQNILTESRKKTTQYSSY